MARGGSVLQSAPRRIDRPRFSLRAANRRHYRASNLDSISLAHMQLCVKLTSNGNVRLSLIPNRFGLVALSLAHEDHARLFVPSISIKLGDINLYLYDLSREGPRDRSIYLDERSAKVNWRTRPRGSKSVSF